VEEVQPGVQYGWTDRAAAQIKYRVRDAEGETLLLTFKNAQDQAFFIKMLKERGYRVGTGIPTGL
jgi:hypothetical protein